MYYRVQVIQPTHGRLPGEILAIKAIDGQIGNALWRKRVSDEERYNVGALAIIDRLDEAPTDVAVIDENGSVIAPIAPAAPAVSSPAEPSPWNAIDELRRRVMVLEQRGLPPDLTEAVRRVIEDAVAMHDKLDGHARRLAEIEASGTPPTLAAKPGSWGEILAGVDNGNNLSDVVARIQALEDKTADPAPLPASMQRKRAAAMIADAVRARLLDCVSGEVLHQIALLAKNGNAAASVMLANVRQDTAAYAAEIIERREGTPETRAGSEWDRTVRLTIARDKWTKAVADASDVAIEQTLQMGLAEIGRIGGA